MMSTWHARRIPVCIVNGRISEKAFKRYLRMRSVLEPLLRQVKVLPRTETDAQRFRALGVPAEACSAPVDLKLVADQARPRHPLPDRLEAWFRRYRVLVAASTHPGEESIVLEAWRQVSRRDPRAGLLLAPRHPERVDKDRVFEGLPRWQALRDHASGPVRVPVLVLDTLGELSDMLHAAFLVLVGGTLVPGVGGHNLLEPAVAGRPVLHGPYVHQVVEAATRLQQAGASVEVTSAVSLADVWGAMLGDEKQVRQRGAAAKACVTASSRQAADRLEQFLESALFSRRAWKEPHGYPIPVA